MVEESLFDLNFSQEILPPSADGFDYIWNEFAKSDSSLKVIDTWNIGTTPTDEVNVENLASGSGIQILNSENETEIGEIAPQSSSGQAQQQSSPVAVDLYYAPSSLPASQTWPGPHGFTVSFNQQHKNTKGVAWTFSKIKDKLYVGKDVPCPINFSANSVLSNDVCVRVLALYTSPEQVSEIVHRCINHSMEEIQNKVYEAKHLVRCESARAFYQVDSATGRHSVIVPFENPPAGQQYSTYIYKFACFGSCAGGPNRKPLMLVFTLERGNQVIGRKKLDVKICACPGRDRKTEESQHEAENAHCLPMKRKEPDDSGSSMRSQETLLDTSNFSKSVSPMPKKNRPVPSRDEIYDIKVKNKSCFEFLLQMKKLHDVSQNVTNLSPDYIKAMIYYQDKKRNEDDSD